MKRATYKKYVLYGILTFFGLLFTFRLATLQLFTDKYYEAALRNGSDKVTLYPSRGSIYDRNGKLMVYNDAIYDLSVIPEKVKDMDTTKFCEILSITKEDFIERVKKARNYSRKVATLFYRDLSLKIRTQLMESLYEFPGFVIELKTDRRYKLQGSAHLLGYMGEVSDELTKKNAYYNRGDMMGIAGIERSYEEYLRGKKGMKMILVDKFSLEQGSLAGGKFDTLPDHGENIYSSIDLDLQEFAEKILSNKIGSIVAIEPSTGEILCLANSPSYDPNLLVGRDRAKNFRKLLVDPQKPFFNRALKAKYPPGSTFKTLQALIGLQEGVLTPETRFPCTGGYHMGNHTVGCHPHASMLNLHQSIQQSCNAYYCYLFRSIIDNPKYKDVKIGYQKWIDYLSSFGIGVRTGVDLPDESTGNVPSVKAYNKQHRGQWKSSTIISLSIGQGEVGLTPLQMANQAAIIANRGYWYVPHIIRYIGNEKFVPLKYKEKHITMVDSSNFNIVANGMAAVYQPGGTAWRCKIDSIPMAGKTGTAQNPHGKDHSIFIAFAPVNNPKIAICVIVENGGFGATYAAPIASLIMERYLSTDKTKSKKPEMLKQMMESSLLPADLYRE